MTAREHSVRLAILCSFNLDLIKRDLRTVCTERGLDVEIYLNDYGQWETDVLNPDSGLYRFVPDVVVVFADLADLLQPASAQYTLWQAEDSAQGGLAAWQRVDTVLSALLSHLPEQASMLCHNLVRPPLTSLGVLEGNVGFGLAPAVEVFNQHLRTRCAGETRLLVFDYASLVLRQGWDAWHDTRLWHLGRMRLARMALPHLAASYARQLSALLLPRRKCLVLDLDNTLWGGVIGEDGLAGIQIGYEATGLAYREFQQAVLALSQRGVILAVCSKNNPEDAMLALREHPDMVLRPEHFACLEINWDPKPENLRRIAARLNIGLDSLVFWDDSPVEREMVRHQVPQVLVPEVPEDVSAYAAYLLDLDCFEVLTLTDEDRRRGEMYRQQAERDAYLEQTPPASLSQFYRSLNMMVTIGQADELSLLRIAQLTQRTNQFNFTTRRYSEADVRAFSAASNYRVYGLRLRDRFGDLGLVGAAIVYLDACEWKLDTFLMSCRALGRGAEDAMMAFLAAQAAVSGSKLIGEFVPTKKNEPARMFLEQHVIPLEEKESGVYRFTIEPERFPMPDWVRLETNAGNR